MEQLRLTPIMFELGARPHPPRALYRSYLAQSDVFVGIYWQRYGWVAPDMEISGLEDEFLLSTGMPRLDLREATGAGDGAAARRRCSAASRARTARPTSRSATPAELHDLLLDDLAVLLDGAVRRRSRRRPAPERRTSNLPAPTSTFLGREAGSRRVSAHCSATTTSGSSRSPDRAGPARPDWRSRPARAQVDRFDDGVFFVDLSAEREPDEVFAAIGALLGHRVATTEASAAGRAASVTCATASAAPRARQLRTGRSSAGAGVVELLAALPVG